MAVYPYLPDAEQRFSKAEITFNLTQATVPELQDPQDLQENKDADELIPPTMQKLILETGPRQIDFVEPIAVVEVMHCFMQIIELYF